MAYSNPYWVCLEGIDGSGKSSVAKHLATKLEARLMRLPFDGQLRERILFDKDLSDKARYFLLMADINIALSNVKTDERVVWDRGLLSTLVYQWGLQIEEATMAAWNHTIPRWTFVLDIPVSVALTRSKTRGLNLDEFESATLEAWEDRRNKYLQVAKMMKVPVINTAELPIDQVVDSILSQLSLPAPTKPAALGVS